MAYYVQHHMSLYNTLYLLYLIYSSWWWKLTRILTKFLKIFFFERAAQIGKERGGEKERKGERESEREKALPFSKWLQQLGMGQATARSQELHLDLPHGEVAKALSHLLLLSWAELDVEEQGLEQTVEML